jgi:hypothetical protein
MFSFSLFHYLFYIFNFYLYLFALSFFSWLFIFWPPLSASPLQFLLSKLQNVNTQLRVNMFSAPQVELTRLVACA